MKAGWGSKGLIVLAEPIPKVVVLVDGIVGEREHVRNERGRPVEL